VGIHPKFMIQNVRIAYAEVFGNDHVRCTLLSEDGARQKAIAFRVAQTTTGTDALEVEESLKSCCGNVAPRYLGGRNETGRLY